MATKINYKSDFTIQLRISLCVEGVCENVGWPDYDWEAKFYTTSKDKAYIASNIGGRLTNCYNNSQNNIQVVFNNHGLDSGTLKVEFSAYQPNNIYPDGSKLEVVPQILDIELVRGKGDCSQLIEVDIIPGKIGEKIRSIVRDERPNRQDQYLKRVIVGRLPRIGDSGSRNYYYSNKDKDGYNILLSTHSFWKWLKESKVGDTYSVYLDNYILYIYVTSATSSRVDLNDYFDYTVSKPLIIFTKKKDVGLQDWGEIRAKGYTVLAKIDLTDGSHAILKYNDKSGGFKEFEMGPQFVFDKLRPPTFDEVWWIWKKAYEIEDFKDRYKYLKGKNEYNLRFEARKRQKLKNIHGGIVKHNIWSKTSQKMNGVFRVQRISQKWPARNSDWCYYVYLIKHHTIKQI